MDIQAVAKEFTDALKQGDIVKAESYWAENVVSLEAMDGPMAKIEGREAVHGKGEWWSNAHEVHSMEISGPFIHGDQFAIEMKADITTKETGARENMHEICLYSVNDGKITEERFFY